VFILTIWAASEVPVIHRAITNGEAAFWPSGVRSLYQDLFPPEREDNPENKSNADLSI
jgi:hypothetical protein